MWAQPSVSKQVVPTVCINIVRSREESSRHALKPDTLPDSIEILYEKKLQEENISSCVATVIYRPLPEFLSFS